MRNYGRTKSPCKEVQTQCAQQFLRPLSFILLTFPLPDGPINAKISPGEADPETSSRIVLICGPCFLISCVVDKVGAAIDPRKRPEFISRTSTRFVIRHQRKWQPVLVALLDDGGLKSSNWEFVSFPLSTTGSMRLDCFTSPSSTSCTGSLLLSVMASV